VCRIQFPAYSSGPSLPLFDISAPGRPAPSKRRTWPGDGARRIRPTMGSGPVIPWSLNSFGRVAVMVLDTAQYPRRGPTAPRRWPTPEGPWTGRIHASLHDMFDFIIPEKTTEATIRPMCAILRPLRSVTSQTDTTGLLGPSQFTLKRRRPIRLGRGTLPGGHSLTGADGMSGGPSLQEAATPLGQRLPRESMVAIRLPLGALQRPVARARVVSSFTATSRNLANGTYLIQGGRGNPGARPLSAVREMAQTLQSLTSRSNSTRWG